MTKCRKPAGRCQSCRCSYFCRFSYGVGFQVSFLRGRRQKSTSVQFLTQALRHVIVRPHTAHGLPNKNCLLPLKAAFMRLPSLRQVLKTSVSTWVLVFFFTGLSPGSMEGRPQPRHLMGPQSECRPALTGGFRRQRDGRTISCNLPSQNECAHFQCPSPQLAFVSGYAPQTAGQCPASQTFRRRT